MNLGHYFHPPRWLLLTLAAIALVAAGYFGARGEIFPQGPGRVKPLAEGDQEIAWIAPATSGENWERVVKAARLLAKQWQDVHGGEPLLLDTSRAFLPLTADVPEIGLRFPHSGTLWIRWYKLSGGNDSNHWVRGLKNRFPPPLAVVGGDTSDRALAIAQVLEKNKEKSQPLFLITTASAERYLPPGRPDLENENENWPRLMGVYPGRSFRFCFTNPRMVEATLDFVQSRPNLWLDHTDKTEPKPETKAPPFFLFTLTWLDDGYSKDLAYSFRKLYSESLKTTLGPDTPIPFDEDFIHYSVGDFYQPNPREEMAVGLFLANGPQRGDQPELLVLPTGTQRARRFLRTLSRRAPGELRKIVVANGDAISFNNLYRDRDLAWNIQDMPVPLVVFSHRNPIDHGAGFGVKDESSDRVDVTSTQDLLLYKDLLEAVVLASFRDGVLLLNPDDVLARLKDLRWHGANLVPGGDAATAPPFFDAEGNRTVGTGEHIIALKPVYDGTRVLPEATLSVYRMEPNRQKNNWQRVGQPLAISYDRAP